MQSFILLLRVQYTKVEFDNQTRGKLSLVIFYRFPLGNTNGPTIWMTII